MDRKIFFSQHAFSKLQRIESRVHKTKAHSVEGTIIKLSLVAILARDGFDADDKTVVTSHEALLEVAALEGFTAEAKRVDLYAGKHGKLPRDLAN